MSQLARGVGYGVVSRGDTLFFMGKVLCCTGHRPSKVLWLNNQSSDKYISILETMGYKLQTYLDEGYDHFISGMAQGIDLIFAETVIQFKEHYDLNIKLECVLPCRNQTDKWNNNDTQRYNAILAKADIITVISEVYNEKCMMERNIYMVDHSNTVLGFWNGEKHSGTWNTIRYAQLMNKDIDIVRI